MNVQKIEVNGVGYHVRDGGGDGEAVLLAHGMPDDGNLWRHQVPALAAAGYRVICPDMLGYGGTDQPSEVERYRSTAVVADLVAILDALGIDTAHYVGHDWGAIVGWELAITHPGRLRSATQMTVGHPIAWIDDCFRIENMRWNWYMVMNLHPLGRDAYFAGDGRLLRELLRSHPDRDEMLARLREGQLDAIVNWDRANSIPEALAAHANGLLDGLPPVSVPTLGVMGTADDFLWESQMTGSERLMEAEWRCELFEGAGHWLMLERPDEVNRLLLEWLGRHAGGR